MKCRNPFRYQFRPNKQLLESVSNTLGTIQTGGIQFFLTDYTGRMRLCLFQNVTMLDIQKTVSRKHWTRCSKLWPMNHSAAVCIILFLHLLYTDYDQIRIIDHQHAEVTVHGIPQRVSYAALFT